jgi:hypothetical protein
MYQVTVTPTMPTWNCRQYTMQICATTRAAAIKAARKEYAENWQSSGHCYATYTAKKI